MTNYNERLDEVLSAIVDDNKLRLHRRVAPGTCSCGFNAYSVKGIMLDYGDILYAHIDGCMEKVKAYEATIEKTKQSFTSLIKELVAEAKPTRAVISDDEMGIDRARKSAANHAIDEFEQNLLKALEEV